MKLSHRLEQLNNKLNYMIKHAKEFSRSVIAGVIMAIAKLEALIESEQAVKLTHEKYAREIAWVINCDRYVYDDFAIKANIWDKKAGETRVYLNGYTKKGKKRSFGCVIAYDDGELSIEVTYVHKWIREVIESVEGELVAKEGCAPIIVVG